MNGLTRAVLPALIGLGLMGCGGQPAAKSESKPAGTNESAQPTTKRKLMEGGRRTNYRDEEDTIVPDAPTQAQKAKASRTTAAADEHDGKTAAKSVPPKDDNAAKQTKVELIPVDLAGFDKKIAEWKGKTVVVDCWAMWCLPCVQKFPKFVELSRKRHSENLVFVGLNFDDEEEGIKSAREFLTEHEAGFTNLRMTTKPALVFKKFGVEALPAYLLYAPDGTLSFKATGTNAMDQLESKLANVK